MNLDSQSHVVFPTHTALMCTLSYQCRQSNRPRSPASSVGRPQTGGHHLPHLEHHAHFGWNPPLPGGGQQPGKVQSTALKYGQALQYNQDVTSKIQLLSTRHV